MSLLAIDVGTTGCKAGAFTEDGNCLKKAYQEYSPIHLRPGWAELDSRQVWSAVQEVIREVVVETKRDPVTALSVSAMGEAATPVGVGGEILDTCILSSDMRGAEYVDELKQSIDQLSFYRINPNIMGVNYTLPKIKWLKKHKPDVFDRTEKFLLWGGLVEFMLGCEPFIGYSHASRTLLFDLHREDWSDHLVELSDIDRGKLPACQPGGTLAGIVSDKIAERLGLPIGVKVVVGGHDQCCNALGAGIAEPGRAVDCIGTYECITPVFEGVPDPDAMLGIGLHVEHHVLPGLFVTFLYNQAGSLIKWFRDTFAAERRDEVGIYEDLNAEMPPDPTKLFVLPYFEKTGSPGFVEDASGVIVGLKINTTRGEILKAFMESLTFYFAECTELMKRIGMDTSTFVATGGGAKSGAWLQIKADIFGVPFMRPLVAEAGLSGAAMLAGIGTGVFENAQQAIERFVKPGVVYEPDARRYEIYRERLALYAELFPLMRDYLSSVEGKGNQS